MAVLTAVAVVAATAGGACGRSGPDPSFFAVRPVTRQGPPPCVAPAVARMPPPGGQVVVCYEMGPVAVDAGAVTSAAVVSDGAAPTAGVMFELSPAGTSRWNAMARTAGVGAQVAIVVDGAIVGAPTLQTTDFPGKGVVTGLDPAAAQRLAGRLNRG